MNKEIKGEDFRKMQLTELDMLVEFDKVCRKYNINYVLFGGSLLGAVRHRGYIPWDDDADIGMLREDYETFKKHKDEMNPNICFFQDHDTDHEYRWEYGKLRRTGSTYVRVGQEHLKCKTGIFVDVFQWMIFRFQLLVKCFSCIAIVCRKILWAEVAKVNTVGFLEDMVNLLSKIPADFAFHGYEKYSKKSRNSSPNRVRCLGFPATGMLYKKNPLNERYGMPKSWFTDRAEYMFEGKKLYSSKDYDTVLKYIYGDYMKLPPEDQREPHSPCSEIVFPSEGNR